MIEHIKQQVVLGRVWHTSAALALLLLFILGLSLLLRSKGLLLRIVLLLVCVLSFAGCLYHSHIAHEAWHSPALYLWHYSK